MKEFKGTKGEWGIDRVGRSNDTIYIGVMKPDNNSIGRIVTHIELSEHYKPDVNKEHLANAALIAAAPDLLKACMETLEFLNEMDNPRQESINAQIDTLQSAITKALTI